MPRGGRRLGAGRPRKPIALHLAAGTYRADRHGPRLAVSAEASTPETGWTPTRAERAHLGADGRRLIDRVTTLYDLTVVDGLQLLEAAHAADVLTALRARRAPDLQQIRLWSAFYASLVRMLGLTS